MNLHIFIFFYLISLSLCHSTKAGTKSIISFRTFNESRPRRILHQPLFPDDSAPPPPAVESPPPPPPDTPSSPDIPFFHENPVGPTPDQNQPPPAIPNGITAVPNPTATTTTASKPTKKVAIAMSVGIVTLGMLSALAFFLYRHRVKHPSETQKLVNGNSQGINEDSSGAPPSSFLYIGTVEPTRAESVSEPVESNGGNKSPYHKLNPPKRSDRYRPSPELQPLPPLTKPPDGNYPPAISSSSSSSASDEESNDMAFHTPHGSSLSYEDGYYTPISRQSSLANGSPTVTARSETHSNNSHPFSKRTSPKSRFTAPSPDVRPVIIPSIKQAPPPPPPPPPPQPKTRSAPFQLVDKQVTSGASRRPKFSAPPPAPNLTHLQSTTDYTSQDTSRTSPKHPPPPPPPPPPPQTTPRKTESPAMSVPSSSASRKQQCWSASEGTDSVKSIKKVSDSEHADERLVASSGRTEADDDMDGGKPKLKALHWDKVRATSDRATVWDQLKSSSFQLNEDMMESLFGCNNSTNVVPKEAPRKLVLPPVNQEEKVLDPKKSQNIAILLRALNVTRDEVCEALLDGNPEGLGTELFETLVKMAPTKEEEIKLKKYDGDLSKLGSAERFLKAVLDIPFAFKRVEALLYRANFDTEVNYLRKSFQTLEAASEELKNSRLFLKLLEAVLRTGNRMNVGTNRGDAKAFKLDTLLKLVDIKGTDGKTTLLHFVVQEIIRSEGEGGDSSNENVQKKMNSKFNEDEFKKQGLQVVAGLGRDLSNVKKAATMDSDVLSSYVTKLEMGLEKVRSVLQYERSETKGNFFNSMKLFLRDAEEDIVRIKDDERKALFLVKEVTEYFHGDTAKEEAHPFRIFMIVRDFLNILDQVCKEVGRMQDRIMVGAARSFRIASTASLPVLNKYRATQDKSSDEESSSP